MTTASFYSELMATGLALSDPSREVAGAGRKTRPKGRTSVSFQSKIIAETGDSQERSNRKSMGNRSGEKAVCVNIGCGKTPTEGWENYDNSPNLRLAGSPRLAKFLYQIHLIDENQFSFVKYARTRRIRYANATRKIPFGDGVVKVLSSSHMLEHLDQEEAKLFFSEAGRGLRPGGILRLALLDLRRQVEAYLAEGDADRFMEGTFLCELRPRSLATRIRLLVMGPRNHQWMYDGLSLCRLLESNGFVNAAVVEAGETSISDPVGLNLRERVRERVCGGQGALIRIVYPAFVFTIAGSVYKKTMLSLSILT